MKKNLFIITLLFFIYSKISSEPKTSINLKRIDDQNYNLMVLIESEKSIYSDSISITTDNENLKFSDLKESNNFLQVSKETDKKITINLNIYKNNLNLDKESNLFISFMQTDNEIYKQKFKINFYLSESAIQLPNQTTLDSSKKVVKKEKNEQKKLNNSFSISAWTQNLIKKSSSIWIQLVLVFFLGILMSFTPCIYPVIPITAGILQTQASKSLLYNFFLSICYAFGIATTFAVFGLTAAMGGYLFGQILVQPAFVIFISAFLIYLALSMFGFYDVYIPKFLQTSNNIQQKGSPISAFMFGAISGSIASPCLSPGLALLLTIVASLANKFLGFILLFSFGIGLSIPLIIVGTFSSSISVLPRAGMWMEEIKKIFGFLLFGMSFYYLSNILPINIILWLVSLSIFLAGVYYLYSIQSYDTKYVKLFKNCLGVLFISSSIFISTKAYQKTYYDNQPNAQNQKIWQKDYNHALKKAKQQNKNLIIDIGAQYCTICKAIDNKVFNNPDLNDIFNKFILIKVDATFVKQEPYYSLKNKYDKEIMGAPTILIINPHNGDLLHRWGSELYEMSTKDINEQLELLTEC